jgi:hypothetical protein
MSDNIQSLTDEQKQLESDYATAKSDHSESFSALAAQKKLITADEQSLNTLRTDQKNMLNQ